MHVQFLKHCRACGHSKLKRFLNLPAMPLTDDFVPAAKFGTEFRHDIDVFLCEQCLTAQTQHNVDMGDYYEDYQYAVGGSTKASAFGLAAHHGTPGHHRRRVSRAGNLPGGVIKQKAGNAVFVGRGFVSIL